MERYFLKTTSCLCLSLLLTFFLISCTKKEKTYTKAEFDRALDSILQKKSIEIKQQGKRDLDLRSSIELKPMIDSILHRTPAIDPLPVLDTTGNNSTDTGLAD